MTNIQLAQVTLEFWGAFFTLACAFSLAVGHKSNLKKDHTIIGLLLFNTVLLLSDAFAYIFRGNRTTLGWFAVRISNALVFLVIVILLLFMARYIFLCIQSGGGEASISWYCAVLGVGGIHILLILVNLVNGYVYTFDEMNLYHRADGYVLVTLFGLAEMIVLLALILWHWSYIDKLERRILLLYILLPAITAVLQIFFYGLSLNTIAGTIVILLLFLTNQTQRSYDLYATSEKVHQQEMELKEHELALSRKEQELAEARLRISVSQMQPHFLFNTLGSIEQLSRRNQPETTEAIHKFAQYLRGNLLALSTEELRPFEEELDHIKSYLWLEEMRFGDDLDYHEDLKSTHFLVPVLSIQPLIENAIKHGMTCIDEDPLIVTLSTWEDLENYYVRVKDNGCGFDPASLPTDSRIHVGLNNVRSRIELMCCGELTIESEPGHGACFTIRVPKDAE